MSGRHDKISSCTRIVGHGVAVRVYFCGALLSLLSFFRHVLCRTPPARSIPPDPISPSVRVLLAARLPSPHPSFPSSPAVFLSSPPAPSFPIQALLMPGLHPAPLRRQRPHPPTWPPKARRFRSSLHPSPSRVPLSPAHRRNPPGPAASGDPSGRAAWRCLPRPSSTAAALAAAAADQYPATVDQGPAVADQGPAAAAAPPAAAVTPPAAAA